MVDPIRTVSLSEKTLNDLSPSVAVASYNREGLRRSIIHIGVGGFHRSHLATYVHELCAAGHQDWSIVGSGVLGFDDKIAQVLHAQDYLYSLITRAADRSEVEVIGSIVDFIHAHPDPEPLVEAIAQPDVQIVSLTVTEGGYPVDDQTGSYLSDSPNAGRGGAFAAIAAGLDRRRKNGMGPITVMSCDNIMSNGSVARTATLGEARRIDPELSDWIEANISFPNSMVDRITPATVDADRAWLRETHQLNDGWPVVAEPFRQWVIEDSFAGDRLPLEELDVIVTSDVAPYELMKLRLLNAGHSCLAYLAALDGFETVDTAMADATLREFVHAFLDIEAAPTLAPVAGIDLEEYKRSLIERFSNPQIGDQIARLCLDGSAKFPKFLLPTVVAQLRNGGSVALSALALAAWCDYLNGSTCAGEPISLAPDPLLEAAVAHARSSLEEPAAFLAFDDVFSSEIANNPRFVAAFDQALVRLRTEGVTSAINATLKDAAGDHPPE